MTVQEAAARLHGLLAPHGPAFRPYWLNGLGVGGKGGSEKIVLYCLPVKTAVTTLAKIQDANLYQDLGGLFWFAGYPVEITECGPMRLL
jgi:hypothetical protein